MSHILIRTRLFVLFVFLISLLVMPARAEAKPVKHSPQKTHRIVRDVTPLFAAADTQQFSARRHRHVRKYRAARSHRVAVHGYAGADLNVMTPQERSDYYARGQQSFEPATQRRTAHRGHADANGNGAVIGGRPSGCPHAYCGCALSLKYFGRIRAELNLAWNWVKYFPRTSPAPGMAAARRGHVMGLLSHVGGTDWLVYDANSGRGLTREHVRSIAGYVIVNPHASRVASR